MDEQSGLASTPFGCSTWNLFQGLRTERNALKASDRLACRSNRRANRMQTNPTLARDIGGRRRACELPKRARETIGRMRAGERAKETAEQAAAMAAGRPCCRLACKQVALIFNFKTTSQGAGLAGMRASVARCRLARVAQLEQLLSRADRLQFAKDAQRALCARLNLIYNRRRRRRHKSAGQTKHGRPAA